MILPWSGLQGLFNKDGLKLVMNCLMMSKRLFSISICTRYSEWHVIFLQDRIVVPIGLRQTFLNRIHDAHLGVVKYKLLGQDSSFLAQLEC